MTHRIRLLLTTVATATLSTVALMTQVGIATAFTPPSDNPRPPRGSTGSGASRGLTCGTAPKHALNTQLNSVQALLPNSNIGYTATQRPIFVAYLPETAATEVVFTLKDAERQTHFRTTAPISGKSGWFTLQLPDNAPPLQLNQHYQWFLAVKCNGKLRPGSPFVEGWIKRVQATQGVNSTLSQSPSLEKADVLGAAGLWYDTAATLGQLHQMRPSDPLILASWRKLLGWSVFNESEIDALTQTKALE